MNQDLRTLYPWVKFSRERLFAWAEALPDGVYTQDHPDFAYGSLRNVQAHIAGCYLVWVGRRGLNDTPHLDSAAIPDVAAMREVFAGVDAVMERAFGAFTTPDEEFDLPLGNEVLRVTQRWLVMHPITHEFHHKGQMLTMGRVLGHPYPAGPDTDLGAPGDVTTSRSG
ncbi:putative damage-inducible protein DinB [Deinococcus metalli]|uniref:DNA damage-inducible protein DinB n=1 Tax=Deinococcus metalli TaxID=1141878 RepID=A0A7W8NSD7_9DEIO|nr:DinB family protein [Deinococcus metalli]MBB5378845.1 putative damage-inducible protein DinB [Deinococcus metalli]GHF62112.1 DNA damage-inducible protein DinB [Deinococcus metalli]